MRCRLLFFLLFFFAFSSATINVIEYYGDGCSHCEATTAMLFDLAHDYNLTIEGKEVNTVPVNQQEMFAVYFRFGLDPSKAGLPTILVNNESLVVGEISKDQWQEIFNECTQSGCKQGVYTQDSFFPLENSSKENALFGAAIIDSINIFKIALIVIPLGILVLSKGKKEIMLSGIVFNIVVAIVFLLMTFGIVQAAFDFSLTSASILIIAVSALILSMLEMHVYLKGTDLLKKNIPFFLPIVALIALFSALLLLPAASSFSMLVIGALGSYTSLNSALYSLLYMLFSFAPSFLLFLAVYFAKAKAESAKTRKEKNAYHVHLVSGLVLLALSLIMIMQLSKS